MYTQHQIQPSKIYSAAEAFVIISNEYPALTSESDFRDILRKDIADKNVFNAKMYVKGSQPRFIISGVDLAKGLKQFMLLTS